MEQSQTPTSWHIIRDLYVYKNCLYATGLIDTIDALSASNLVCFDGNYWQAVGAGIFGTGFFLTELNDELYVTGGFSMSGELEVHNVVKLENAEACEITGLSDLEFKSKENTIIYPNRVGEFLYLDHHPDNHGEASESICIYDAMGNLVQNFPTDNSCLFVGDLPKGIYLYMKEMPVEKSSVS